MDTPLFRQQAVAALGERHLGEPSLAQPLPLSWIGIGGVIVALALIAFVSLTEVTRKAHVNGYLVPDQGLVKVLAPQAGTLVDKRVAEGQRVARGDILFVLSGERSSLRTGQTQAAAIARLGERRASLQRELAQADALAALSRQDASARLQSLRSEETQLQAEIATQIERLAGARRVYAQHEELARQGFVAPIQLAGRREQVLEQQARLQALVRSRTALEREIGGLVAERAALAPKSANARAAIERGISALDQERTEAEARREIVIAAPTDGVVTTILAERGQSVVPSAALLSILPAGAAFEAHLFVPSRSAGFVAAGQPVALRYQAFPFERFGIQEGTVKEVSRSLVVPGETALPLPLAEPAYRITVTLQSQAVRAYGKRFALAAGMQLDADIVLDRRRLIEWVFDPVLAAMGRT